jgi:metal transporter CNNM
MGAQQFKDIPPVSIPEAVHEEREDQPRSASTRKGSSRTASLHFGESPTELIYHHRGPARSGSITEQIVDVNGIRKVVLHTNGISSSEGERSPLHTRDSSPTRKDIAIDANPLGSEHSDSHANSKSKKRRRRKKHGQHPKPADGGSSEDQPLLQ